MTHSGRHAAAARTRCRGRGVRAAHDDPQPRLAVRARDREPVVSGQPVCAAPPPGARTLIPIVRTVIPIDRIVTPIDRTAIPIVCAAIPIVRTLIPIVRTLIPIVHTAIRIIGSNCIRFGSASTGVQRWRTALALSQQCNLRLPSVLRYFGGGLRSTPYG